MPQNLFNYDNVICACLLPKKLEVDTLQCRFSFHNFYNYTFQNFLSCLLCCYWITIVTLLARAVISNQKRIQFDHSHKFLSSQCSERFKTMDRPSPLKAKDCFWKCYVCVHPEKPYFYRYPQRCKQKCRPTNQIRLPSQQSRTIDERLGSHLRWWPCPTTSLSSGLPSWMYYLVLHRWLEDSVSHNVGVNKITMNRQPYYLHCSYLPSSSFPHSTYTYSVK